MSEQFEVTISDDGIKIDATGYKDNMCLKELEEFVRFMKSKGIDVQITDQKMKTEGMKISGERVNVTTKI